MLRLTNSHLNASPLPTTDNSFCLNKSFHGNNGRFFDTPRRTRESHGSSRKGNGMTPEELTINTENALRFQLIEDYSSKFGINTSRHPMHIAIVTEIDYQQLGPLLVSGSDV